MHGQVLSLQRLKTDRLPTPADQASLVGCQHFCLWTGYHLAPRAVPRRRGLRSQFPAESPICRPWKSNKGEEGRAGRKGVTFITLLNNKITTLSRNSRDYSEFHFC